MAKLAEKFGQEVKARRRARAMTQNQLAEAAAMSEEWVRRIERGVGAPSFDAIEALAAALGVSVADLFSVMSARDGRAAKIDAMLVDLDEVELTWLERLIREAKRYPRS